MEKLTKKQRGFVKDYIETDNGTQAALKNYDTKDYKTAASIANENLNKPDIINAINSLAESIPDELITEKHLALLNKSDFLGQIDVPAVSKGLDMAYKLKGSYAPDKQININLNQEMTPEALARAKAFDQWFKNQQTSKT